MDLARPPDPDELELSLFGPGYGESLALHLGYGDWMIVDSSVDAHGAPAAIRYLESLQVDVARAVQLIVATHWHDDHVRGISQTLAACESASLACSAALSTREFLTLVSAGTARPLMENAPGTREFHGVLQVLRERRRLHSPGHIPRWASADRLLWSRPASALSHEPVSVLALSPSDAALLVAKLAIANLLPREGAPKGRLAEPRPNHASVVLWVTFGRQHLLLGADLEETRDPTTGWTAIVTSALRPQARATIFKVPHHGSATGHCQAVWEEMLIQAPFAILTPFRRGRQRLPSDRDVTRLAQLTNRAYLSAPSESRAARFSNRLVREMVHRTTRYCVPVGPSRGHIRLRRRAADEPADWTAELFGSALRLAA